MTRIDESPRAANLLTVALLLGAAVILLPLSHANQEPAADATEVTDFEAAWKEVDRLVSEQKHEAASKQAERIRLAAVDAGDADELTRALIKTVQLRTGLHGYETSVRFLREEEWPDDPLSRGVLDLFYAHSLVHYYHAYLWEIGQRERVDTGDEVDLKSWTRDQIYDEARRAYRRVWVHRGGLGTLPVETIGEYLQQNNYPEHIRGTLRDAVTYLWVELLADTSFWRPEQLQEVYRLDLEALATGEARDLGTTGHPLKVLAAILADLEKWHSWSGRAEAAFEARRVRLERLAARFQQAADKERIRDYLVRGTEELGRDHEWWSMGMASVAEMVRTEGDADSQVRAREIALAGVEAHPSSIGGQRCQHIVATIEAPAYRLASMAHDGPDRRSIEVTHRNLATLHFRAYPVDLIRHLARSRDYSLLPGALEVSQLLETGTAVAQWSVALPSTPDYRDHRTFVTPALRNPGLYVVVASARDDFAKEDNQLLGIDVVIGDLVLVSRDQGRSIEVTARSGKSGFPLAQVAVHLYRFDWQKKHRRVSTARTGSDGRVRFDLPGSSSSHFLVAEYQDQVAIDLTHLYPRPRPEPGQSRGSLVYTDRTVYRPGQKVLFKVVAFHGGGKESRFETLTGAKLDVELLDANHEVVETRTVTSNDFGTASGEIEIPTGRLLGAWRLRTSLGGSSALRVEEYKRPTFEVTLDEPAAALRLNRPAELSGEARYYFGLPVAAGDVDWRVVREPVYPSWWFWYGYPRESPQVVAAGTTALDDEGRFRIAFTPEADERQKNLTYRYKLSAEVTDEGGETRQASRAFRLGLVAIEADVVADEHFFFPGVPIALAVERHDLDGTPRAGEGSWRLLRVEQPAATALPADQPMERADVAEGYQTPGDRLRPRWQSDVRPEAVLRSWPDGEELARGSLTHDARGRGELELAPLAAGVYRLRYETADAFGARYRTQRELVVAGSGQASPRLPAVLLAERPTVRVGETARLLVHSGLAHQEMVVETFRWNRRVTRRVLTSDAGLQVIEIPIEKRHRGGFGVALTLVRDHQLVRLTESLFVPWDDRELQVEFATFRDRLRPGRLESWRVTVRGPDGEPVGARAAEVLAYMYDRSLDLFAPHAPPRAGSLYPNLTGTLGARANLGAATVAFNHHQGFGDVPGHPPLWGDSLVFYSGYGIGGLRHRSRVIRGVHALGYVAERREEFRENLEMLVGKRKRVARQAYATFALAEPELASSPAAPPPEEPSASPAEEPLRSDFSETAFFEPHLLTAADGSASFTFEVPDSVTEWNVWVHAVTRDLAGGSLSRQTRSVKELLVRPYLPRFLREGDRAEIAIVVNNAGDVPFSGSVDFAISDPESGESLLAEFGLAATDAESLAFEVEPGGGANLKVPVRAPVRVGTVAVEVRASANAADRQNTFADGERRPLPLLPGRVHLAQSRFATLKDSDRRTLRFADLAAGDDPSLIHDRLVVTLDGQLFYGVLNALPYLIDYPYECTEQTLNRFVSTGIVSSVFEQYPAVARMAKKLAARRDTRLPTWEAADPNRRMTLVETPWLAESRGGKDDGADLIKVLDPRVAKAQRKASLAKLRKAQTSLGAFPWWPGGPPSPYMTLYLLHGFSKALEFEVDVPRQMVQRAWGYMHRHYIDKVVNDMMAADCCWEFVTFLNYTLSSYPDDSWTGSVFSAEERRTMLAFSFRYWRDHSPLSKAQLALTLQRMDRPDDAALVFDSIMDSAKTTPDQGTFWAPEDRAWLWYNDTVEGHSFALRAMTELAPGDARRHGLVQWLLLNRKLNHWKSTRATAEVIYALVHYLEREGALGIREAVTVAVGPELEREFVFEPDEYTGGNNQVVVAGAEVTPAMAEITVAKDTPGLLFASATWHFSTEQLPAEARGDFFEVHRRYFRRVLDGGEWKLQPLLPSAPLRVDADSAAVEVGDQLEVQLSIRTRHAAEYVHLRDPRGAGFEPESLTSRFKWDLGLGYYEEVRDSGTNFFFEWLPAGEYTFKYRLRANMSGTFRVGPATLQSMYAPEFTAYSAGSSLRVGDRRSPTR